VGLLSPLLILLSSPVGIGLLPVRVGFLDRRAAGGAGVHCAGRLPHPGPCLLA